MHKDLNYLASYTQMQDIGKPPIATKTKECNIILENGKVLIDSISSWWTSCLGYNNPFLLKAVSKQLNTMPHVMFGGLIHKQAISLSKKITSLMKNDLEKVFVDSGSLSVKLLLKWQFNFGLIKDIKKRKVYTF